MLKKINPDNPVICWFSGGVTSTIACKFAIDLFGVENCRGVFIDTKNEDDDTYRFLDDCEDWLGIDIEDITNENYNSIQEVWRAFSGLNFAHGAICSSELKREVRIKFQRENPFSHQVFGFDITEPRRALSLKMNYPEANPIFPLLLFGYTKKDCIRLLEENNIDVPQTYKDGFLNNNCFKTGCVQGGIGYWQKMKREFPQKFYAMAKEEHTLTNTKGDPVTMLKDQSKKAKAENNQRVFLLPHPDYPNIKDISMMKGREPEPLVDCNGLCGLDDLK